MQAAIAASEHLGRIESIGPAVRIGIEKHLCTLAAGYAAISVLSGRDNVVFQHHNFFSPRKA